MGLAPLILAWRLRMRGVVFVRLPWRDDRDHETQIVACIVLDLLVYTRCGFC